MIDFAGLVLSSVLETDLDKTELQPVVFTYVLAGQCTFMELRSSDRRLSCEMKGEKSGTIVFPERELGKAD